MKGPSRKQIIIPMNKENKLQFIKDSSSHIANINRVLKILSPKLSLILLERRILALS